MKSIKKRLPKIYEIMHELFAISVEFSKSLENKEKILKIVLDKNFSYTVVFLHLFNRSIENFYATEILCRNGLPNSGLIQVRPFIENLISAKYLSYKDVKTREKLAMRFLDYSLVEISRFYEPFANYDFVEIPQEMKKGIIKTHNELNQKCGEFKINQSIKNNFELSRSWSGKGIYEMAEEAKMLVTYQCVYRFCCSFTHPSILRLQSKKSEHPNLSDILYCLSFPIKYMPQFLSLYNDLFDLDKEIKIKIIKNRIKEVLDEYEPIITSKETL